LHLFDQTAVSPVSRTVAARLLNVGERSVASASKVIDDGVPDLVDAVERGKVSVSAAADIASLPKPQQQQIVARGEREILQAAKQIRAEKADARREERLERIVEISKGNSPLDVSVRYPVIYADPPWRYENPPMGGSNRSIENHYPTMSLEEICACLRSGLMSAPSHSFSGGRNRASDYISRRPACNPKPQSSMISDDNN
jgi:hypothetical protein